MEPKDPKLEAFLESVFYDVKMKHAESGAINLSSPIRTRAGQYPHFKRQLSVMYRALHPMHTSGFETLFRFLPLNHDNALSLMRAHCSAVWEDCYEEESAIHDTYITFIYTCSFTFSLLEFCETETQSDYLHLFAKWIVAVWTEPIEPKFTAANGWEGMETFCSSHNLHFILDFINLCYNKQGKLFTYVTLNNSYYFYGLHHDDTISLLKNNFQDFKESVFNEFKYELDSNLIYKTGVIVAFVKIELALDLTANVFNPPSPTRRLLNPTPNMFKTHLWDTLKNDIPASIAKLLIKQSKLFARQKRKFYMQRIIKANKERARAYQQQSPSGRAFDNLDDIVATVRRSVEAVKRGSAFKEHEPYAKIVPGVKEQIHDLNEQASLNLKGHEPYAEVVPSVEEQVPDLNEKTSISLKHDVHTMQQIINNTEQALAALNLYTAAEALARAQLTANAEQSVAAFNLYNAPGGQLIQPLYANVEQSLTAINLYHATGELPTLQLYPTPEQALAASNLYYATGEQPMEQSLAASNLYYSTGEQPMQQSFAALNLYHAIFQQPMVQLSANPEQSLGALNLNHATYQQPIVQLSANPAQSLAALNLNPAIYQQPIVKLSANPEQSLDALNSYHATGDQPTKQLSASAEEADDQIKPDLIADENTSASAEETSNIQPRRLPLFRNVSVEEANDQIKPDLTADKNASASAEETSNTQPRRQPLFRVVLVREPPDAEEVPNVTVACTTCCFHKPKK